MPHIPRWTRRSHTALILLMLTFLPLALPPGVAAQTQTSTQNDGPTRRQTTDALPDIATFSSPSLAPEPALDLLLGSDKQANRSPALAEFLATYGSDWEIRWDRASNRPHLMQGPGIALLPRKPALADASEGFQPSLEQVEDLTRQFLWRVADLLRVDPDDLVFDRLQSRLVGRQQHLWLVHFQQQYLGLPVEGARVFLRINHGNVVQFGTERLAGVRLDTRPSLPQDEVFHRALDAVAGLGEINRDTFTPSTPRLRVFPTLDGAAYAHRLVWEMDVQRRADGQVFRWRLDAHSGELLEVTSRRTHAEATGQVTGRVHMPQSAQIVNAPLPYLWVENQGLHLTDAAGAFNYQGGQASASLEGALIEIQDACGPSLLTQPHGQLDFGGSPAGDCSVTDGGPGNTQAARDAYYHLTTGYEDLMVRFPTWFWPQPLVAQTNLPVLSCEASWDASQATFSFAASSPECTNVGQLPSILLHEVGHTGDSVLGGVAPDGASGEAQADLFAFLQTGDACIGRGLRPGIPCLNCNATCDGARDLAAFLVGGNAPIAKPSNLDAANGLQCDRFACPYPGGSHQRGPLGFQAHCESQIASSAMLDVLQELIGLRGVVTGKALFEELWFTSLPALGSAYRRVPSAQMCQADDTAVDGCGANNWYSVLLAADDDDGNLANGTPNGCRIWQAFDAHGIACGEQPACFCKEGGLNGHPDAGPDVRICRGDYTLLGTPGDPAKSYVWSPGGETTPQIYVAPQHTTEYTLAIQNTCGVTQDSVVVEVVACNGFSEDFESNSHDWSTSGTWHRVEDTPCVTPSASSGQGAMYFGVETTCQVDPKDNRPRDLISPLILVDEDPHDLRFDYYLAEHRDGARLGRAEVAIQVDGSTAWEPRWATEIAELEGSTWNTSPAISMRPYAGKTVRLRFRFETYVAPPGYPAYFGWLIDNVRMEPGRKLDDRPMPTLSLIEAPIEPISQCECIRCRFSAVDADGRDISELLAWSSDLDGDVAAGSRSTIILSPGAHHLTGTVTDYEGISGSLTIEVEVTESPTLCGPGGWPPAEPRLHCKDDEAD